MKSETEHKPMTTKPLSPEERVERARKAMFNFGAIDNGWMWDVLRAAFPEYFAGTHVLLPREPTEAMMDAFGDEEAEAFWRACMENRKRRKELLDRNPDFPRDEERDNVLAAAWCQTFPDAYKHMIAAYESTNTEDK